MDRRGFVAGVLAVAGCATAGPVLQPGGETYAELEAVSAITSREGLRLIVPSSGCTGKADWAVWREARGRMTALAFARRRLDRCRGMPGGTAELVFSWDELGVRRGSRVTVLNPVRAP